MAAAPELSTEQERAAPSIAEGLIAIAEGLIGLTGRLLHEVFSVLSRLSQRSAKLLLSFVRAEWQHSPAEVVGKHCDDGGFECPSPFPAG